MKYEDKVNNELDEIVRWSEIKYLISCHFENPVSEPADTIQTQTVYQRILVYQR